MKVSVLIILVVVSALACRDVSQSPGGPSFSNVADTTPGGCTAAQCHFNTRGAAASVGWSDPGTTVSTADTGGGGGGGGTQVFGYVSVSRSTTQTFLYYGVTECGPWGCSTVRGGYGTIPNSDFSGNANSMRLSTNTTGNPNFFTYAGSTGPIETTWTANGLFEWHSNGTTQRIQPGLREQMNGQSDDVSATASGAVVAYPIVAAANSGNISTNHNVSVVINH
jgi:hypothetical protein